MLYSVAQACLPSCVQAPVSVRQTVCQYRFSVIHTPGNVAQTFALVVS